MINYKNLSLLLVQIFVFFGFASAQDVDPNKLMILLEGDVSRIKVLQIENGQILVNGGLASDLGIKVSHTYSRDTVNREFQKLLPRYNEKGYLGFKVVEKKKGVTIESLYNGSQAKKVGLDPRDVILSINEELVTSKQQLEQIMKTYSKGDRVVIGYKRRGKIYRVGFDLDGTKTLIGREARKPDRIQRIDYIDEINLDYKPFREEPKANSEFGIKIREDENKSVKVISVIPGSKAEQSGFEVGDIITNMNGKPIQDIHTVKDILTSLSTGKPINTEVLRNSLTVHIIIEK